MGNGHSVGGGLRAVRAVWGHSRRSFVTHGLDIGPIAAVPGLLFQTGGAFDSLVDKKTGSAGDIHFCILLMDR